MQGWTIWETLANTIEADDLTLYLVLDEAHRGFNTKATRDKPTIVRRLVNGHEGAPADSDRVGHLGDYRALRDGDEGGGGDQATGARCRRSWSTRLRVQESGLVKDTARPRHP